MPLRALFSSLLRAGLVLGRVSNLPTVWSNLLAGWFLAGGEIEVRRLALLLCGGSLLYVGGMYLNDWCDAVFDRAYRAERPIPAGTISRFSVGCAAGILLSVGFVFLALSGPASAATALLLVAGIIFYDVVHKRIGWAPWIMAMCRFLLYPLAASGAGGSITLPVWMAAAALAAYVAGITYLARSESRPGTIARAGLLLLLMPAGLAGGRGIVEPSFALFAFLALFLFWLAWSILPLRAGERGAVGRTVSGLLAGIVLVDLLALAPALEFRSAWLLVFFGLALLGQRVIPAT